MSGVHRRCIWSSFFLVSGPRQSLRKPVRSPSAVPVLHQKALRHKVLQQTGDVGSMVRAELLEPLVRDAPFHVQGWPRLPVFRLPGWHSHRKLKSFDP